jgi:hypothetical protein
MARQAKRIEGRAVLPKILAVIALVVAFCVAALPAFGAGNPNGTGQPSQSCEEQPTGPPGFNPSGFAQAQSVYANVDGTHQVSQYDVACYQLSQPH